MIYHLMRIRIRLRIAYFRYQGLLEGEELFGPYESRFLVHLEGRYSVRFISDWVSVLSSSSDSRPFEGACEGYY